MVSLFHQMRRSVSLPTAAESSAYHTCLLLPSDFLMRGTVARAYMGIARGSPWVVPSWDSRESPSTNRSVGAWYVLTRAVAMDEHDLLIFCRAT